jgi:hypothetical protein
MRHKAQEIETRLYELKGRIEYWRQTRTKKSPMPSELWNEAVQLTPTLGWSCVAEALGLNHERLKQHCTEAERAPEFIEVDGAQLFGAATGSVVELTSASGERLTIRLGPGSKLDVAEVVEAFQRSAR